jgi:hypothetical protein
MENSEINIDDYISVKEAADMMKCSTVRVYNSLSKLPHIKIGSTCLIHRSKLEELLKHSSVEDILPSRAHWDRFTEYLKNSGESLVALSINEIIEISGSNSLTLQLPAAWDPNNATKRRAAVHTAMLKAGYDIAEMKFAFSDDYMINTISEITFEQIKNNSKRKTDRSINAGGIMVEQKGLKAPNYTKIFVNSDPATLTTRIHVDSCYYVQKFIHGEELPKGWKAYETLGDAESACIKDKKQAWRYCLRCFEKRG